MKAPTLKAIRETLAAHAPGIVIRKEESGEYRVTFSQAAIAAAFPGMTRAELIEKAESLASYDSDICGAYETGKAMFRVGLNPATVEPTDAAAREAADEMGFGVETVSASPVMIGAAETVRLNIRRQREEMAEIANNENAATVAVRSVRTVDATPTWAAILPLLRAAIENGTPEGRRIAWEELARMADAADKWNASAKADATDVIQSYEMRGDGVQAAGAIVLRRLEGAASPYVVHFRNNADSERMGRPCYYSGDYCATLADAWAAFSDKVRRYDPTGALAV